MDEFEILLDGDYGWEITLAYVVGQLAEANGKDLYVKMNSTGGSVVEGTAIKNSFEAYLRKYDAKITFEVVGWVQSAATYNMMIPGAKIVVHPNSLFMYHNPQMVAVGDYREMRDKSEFLSNLTTLYGESYATMSGKPLEDVLSDMNATTKLIGQAIIDAGFATHMDDGDGASFMRGDSRQIMAFGDEQFGRCVGRLTAAAHGSDSDKFAPALMLGSEPDGDEGVNDGKGDIDMSDKMTPEERAELAAKAGKEERERAKACMSAQRMEPKLSEQLQTAYDDGKPASYFDGIVAAAEMRRAKEENVEASGDSKEVGDIEVEDKSIKGHVDTPVMTAGRTGALTEV